MKKVLLPQAWIFALGISQYRQEEKNFKQKVIQYFFLFLKERTDIHCTCNFNPFPIRYDNCYLLAHFSDLLAGIFILCLNWGQGLRIWGKLPVKVKLQNWKKMKTELYISQDKQIF